jgi:hypothetical protein
MRGVDPVNRWDPSGLGSDGTAGGDQPTLPRIPLLGGAALLLQPNPPPAGPPSPPGTIPSPTPDLRPPYLRPLPTPSPTPSPVVPSVPLWVKAGALAVKVGVVVAAMVIPNRVGCSEGESCTPHPYLPTPRSGQDQGSGPGATEVVPGGVLPGDLGPGDVERDDQGHLRDRDTGDIIWRTEESDSRNRTRDERRARQALGLTKEEFRRGIHDMKRFIEGNPDVEFDLDTGGVFDLRSGEPIGNLLDYRATGRGR